MKESGSKATRLLKKRIRSIHRRAKFVGILYLLATIALAALACLPLIKIENSDYLWLINLDAGAFAGFVEPFTALTSGAEMDAKLLLDVVSAVLYVLVLLIAVINVMRCFTKLNFLFKKKASRSLGFNRNMFAMDQMGKAYSASFIWMVVLYFFIIMIRTYVFTTTFTLIALAVGVAFHFICGLIGSSVTLFVEVENDEQRFRFTYGENGGTGWSSNTLRVEEQKREQPVRTFFLRNVIQVVLSCVMMYFFLSFSTVGYAVTDIVGGNMDALMNDMMGYLIPVAVQLLTAIMTCVVFSYALSTNEYDRDCMGDKVRVKRRWNRANICLVMILAVVSLVLPLIAGGEIVTNQILFIILALSMFVLDVVIFPRDKKKWIGGVIWDGCEPYATYSPRHSDCELYRPTF